MRRHLHAHNRSPENTDHIFTCPSTAASTSSNTQMIKLEYFLKQTTSSELQQSILKIVGALRHRRDPIYDEGWRSDYKRLTTKQINLGQRAFLGGFWIT
jgi:hypothetical protein